ncbi:hypothetical protein ABB02_01130 [Clostridiaceae bacterium JG1575]|nr:hypothetical protein ABB02_01130 [Clostridiaceae bacterium JG1575]
MRKNPILKPLDAWMSRRIKGSLLLYSLYGMVAVYLLLFLTLNLRIRIDFLLSLGFSRNAVLQGQIWRIVTFPFVRIPAPYPMDLIWFGFSMLIYYMGIQYTEARVGRSRMNSFAVLCWLFLLLYGLLFNRHVDFSPVVLATVVLAGLYNPDFQLYIYFILPIRGRFIALLGTAFLLIEGIQGAHQNFAVLLVLLLMTYDILGDGVKSRVRKQEFHKKAGGENPKAAPRHRCAECGITEKEAPDMIFRYCSSCKGNFEYCEDHIHNHKHRSNVISMADHQKEEVQKSEEP